MPPKNAFGTPEGACFSNIGVLEITSFVVDGAEARKIIILVCYLATF